MIETLEEWIKKSPNARDIKAVFETIENLPTFEQHKLWGALNDIAVERRKGCADG